MSKKYRLSKKVVLDEDSEEEYISPEHLTEEGYSKEDGFIVDTISTSEIIYTYFYPSISCISIRESRRS